MKNIKRITVICESFYKHQIPHFVRFIMFYFFSDQTDDQTDYQIDYPTDDKTDYIDYDNYIYATQSKFLKKTALSCYPLCRELKYVSRIQKCSRH